MKSHQMHQLAFAFSVFSMAGGLVFTACVSPNSNLGRAPASNITPPTDRLRVVSYNLSDDNRIVIIGIDKPSSIQPTFLTDFMKLGFRFSGGLGTRGDLIEPKY